MPRDEEETTTAKPKPKYATNPFANTRGANVSANRPRPTAQPQQQRDYSEGQTNEPTQQREQTIEQKLGQQPKREAPYKYITDPTTGLTRKQKLPGALSGTYRAPSATMEKVQRGEANWTDVFTAERERILKDPNFYKTNQITQYSPAIQQQIIADKAFDWTQVPKWQRPFYEASSRPAVAGAVQGLVMGLGNPGGAVVGAAIGAAAQATGYDQTKEAWQQGDNKFTWDANQLKEAGKGAFGYLNLLAEWGEKMIGTAAMAVNAAADPTKEVKDVLNKDTFNANASFFEVIAPAIKAAEQGDGRITWSDAQKLIPALWQGGVVADLVLNPEKYKGEEYYLGASMPVELQQTWTERIEEARAEIAKGRDYREVMTEMQTGIMAQIGDMAGQGVFDPLNVMPKVETGIIRKGAELAGNKVAAEAFTGVETPREGIQKFRNIIQTGEAAKIDPNFDAQKLNGFEKAIAGLNKQGEVKAGGLTNKGLLDPADPKKPTGGLFEETPQSRAQTGATMFDRNIGTLMTMFKDPTEAVGYIRKIAGGDMNAWKELGSRIGNSPEWYTILPALKDFSADKLEGLAKAWEVTAINRDALNRVADVLGDNPTKLIDDWAARNNTDQDFARIIQRAKDANTPESNALLKEFEAGTFTPDTLKQIVDLFHGEGALPHTEAQWKWAMYADMSDHFAEWVAQHLLLDKSPEATSSFFQTMAVLKQAQSIILLGASPGYAIQNGLSGIVHLATDGIYGSMTPRQMDDWITRWETPIPRLDEGVGIGGMVDTARSTAISDAMKPGKGPLTDLKQTLSRIQRGMPMSKLSSKFESVNSKRGYVTGIKKFWANSWRRGVGFRKMEPALAKVLTDAGIDPNRIYAAIEAGANQKEIERALTGQYKGMQAKALINDAAQSAGITPAQAADMLDKIGLTETLDTFLAGADTPDKVDAAFTRANKKMQDWIDMKYGERLATRAEEVKNIVGREGMAAGLNVAQQASNQFYDAWFDHYARFGDVMGGLEGLEPAQRSKVIEEAYRQSDTNFRRVFASMGANYQGIFEVWGLSGDPDATSAVHAISDMNNSMKEAYDFMRQKRNEFSATLNREDRAPTSAELRTLNTGIDKAFDKAFKTKHAAEIRMGDALKGVYTKLHGANAGNAAKLWWNDVMKFSEKIVADEKRFRAEQDTAREMGADRASLSDAKKKYYSENKQRWIADLQKINDEGIARLERIIKGRSGDATPTTAPTDPTPPSDTGPATPAPTAEQTAPRDTPPAAVPKKPTKAQERAAREADEINKLLADVKQLDLMEQAERATQVNSVWSIAETYWNRGGNYSRATMQDKFALLNVLKKPEYGGIADLMGLYDPRLDGETVTRILDTRKAIKDAEAATATPPSIREIKKRKAKDSANVNILDAIRSYGGLNIAKITDYAKDKKVGSMFGVFQKQAYSKGWDITDMAMRLAGDNYPIDLNDPADPGGAIQTQALLDRALAGEQIYPTTHDYTADAEKINAAELAHIEALKADEEAFTVEQFNAETWKARMQEAIAKKDGEAVDTLFGELPDDLSNTPHDADGETYAEYILRAQNNIEADAINDARATAIATAKTQADAAVKDSETRAEAVTTRTLMLESWTEIFGAEQAQTYMEMSDAFAQWYERETGQSADEFYSRYYEEARKSVEADVIGDLEQSYRVGENVQNRRLTAEDAQNYARMIARSESEARSAIRNEPNKADRIAILKALHDINPDMAESVARAAKADMLLQTVFHGSPYKFDKFSLDHLGTGEGAQAYGWGLYFAGSRNVAEWYRAKLSTNLSNYNNNDAGIKRAAKDFGYAGNKGAEDIISAYLNLTDWTLVEKHIKEWGYRNEAEMLKMLPDIKNKSTASGQLYAVDIPDDNYLLWDKPLSEQPRNIQEAVNSILPEYKENSDVTGADVYRLIINTDGSDKAASLALKEAGINGIQYLDGSSRGKGDGNYNYVIFDDSAVKVLETFYQAEGMGAKGAVVFGADGIKATIHAFEAADFSTLVHENAHVFRRVMKDVAERTGNKQVVKDLATIEEWAGVKDGNWTVPAEEKFARGFENYIATGEAPTPRLKKAFETFKGWMMQVYRTITGSAIDVKITDEVKGVFDRMLGAEAQTQKAEGGSTALFQRNKAQVSAAQFDMFAPRPEVEATATRTDPARAWNGDNWTVNTTRTEVSFNANEQLPADFAQALRDAGFTQTDLMGAEWRAQRTPETKAFIDKIGKPAPETYRPNPYAPTITTDLPNQPIQADTGTTGGLLPGMQEATGMMFDVQPGTGNLTKMDAGTARTIYDIDPTKTAGEFRAGDIVQDADGKQHTVSGANMRSKIVTDKGRILDPQDVTRVAKQGDLFSLPPEPKPTAAPEVIPAPGKLADFGEKLGGARKDKAQFVERNIADADIAKLSLTEIWPKSEVDKIEDVSMAALSQALRDLIPSKPRDSWKLQRWVEKVKMIRSLVEHAGVNGVDATLTKAAAYSQTLAGFVDRVNTLRQIPREHWGRIGKIEDHPTAYTYKDGAKIPKPYAIAEVDGRYIEAQNLPDLLTKINEKLNVEVAKASAMKFEIRGNGKQFFINKVGDPLYRKLITFDTVEAARAYKRENTDALVKAWEGVKESDNVKETDVRGAENRERAGKDYRQGKDATPEMFNTFGFRGVEFGNWVSQGGNLKERQGMLNAAYDGLMDLADIVHIPPKALSLNGTLGLGLGSRGSGSASAHFEPDTIVINLTKTRGAGSLAHEWLHALDNYFQRKREGAVKEKMITYQPENYYQSTRGDQVPAARFDFLVEKGVIRNKADWKLIEGVRPEVGEAFAKLVKVIDDSPMTKRVELLDKGKSSKYWSTIVERAARSFEGYVIAKMAQDGYQNDYLANVTKVENFKRDPERFPYLLDNELAPVVEAFDNLFNTVKVDDTGMLYQRAEPTDPFKEADLPIGSIEEAGQQPPHHEAMHEGYLENIAPLMKAMQQVAREQVTNKPLDGAMRDLSPEGAAMLKKYRNQVNADMAGTKNAATKWGEQSRDFAMLNYNKRYGIDRYIETIYPYQFFYTRSLATWAARALDKPAIFSQYARIKKQQDRYERDIPERLRGKIKISLPWLPDWMGDALYIDPMRTLFTPLNYARPFERMIQDSSYQQIEAERILQEWASDGTVAEKDIVDAIKNREGATWERAFAEAQIRRESEIQNPMDFMNTMLGPAWYLTTPYKLLKGEQAGIGSTPILNTTRALDTVTQGTWAQPIGDLIGMIGKPEEMLRQKLNIPEFGEYGDYYVDRQLANMVADGLISSDEAQQAMIERTGANFDTARERVKMELAMRVPTASALLSGLTADNFVQGVARMAMTAPVSLFGAGLLPSGELDYRGLKSEWNEAWKRKDAGDDKAITAFFDDHPEYEAYLSKGKEPEERLRGYLVGQIWDGYMGLGTTDRKQATAEMGDEFQRDFLSTETRSYEGIDIEQLAAWAQMLNKNVPNTTSTAPAIAAPAPKINYYDPEITRITDKFFNDRTRMFPDYYVKQNGYYNIPESDKSGRYKYLAQNPELKQYWDWKKAYEKKYPELVPIIKGQVFKQLDTSAWPPALLDYVTVYAYTGEKLPKGAYKALEQVWLSEGKPLGSVDAWLSSDVAPALLYGGGQ